MSEGGSGGVIRVLELRTVRGTGGGPDKTILVGAAAADPACFDIRVCYFRAHNDSRFGIVERAKGMGLEPVEIVERHPLDPGIWRSASKIVKQFQPHIIHAHDYKTDLLALLLARAHGAIPVSTAHGWSGHTLRERLYYSVDRRLLARYAAVIAVSPVIRDRLVESGTPPDRVKYIPNGVDHQHFRRTSGCREHARQRLAIAPGVAVIGAVGRLESEKRFDILLNAAAKVPGRPIAVVIAGEGGLRQDLQRLAASLGVRLELPGQTEDVRPLLHAFDVYVQSSDTEGIPNSVLEAMAMEVPVVATAVGGTTEIIQEGVSGLLVERRNPGALASGIAATLADPELTARRIASARLQIQTRFSFSSRMAALEELYRGLVGSFDGRIEGPP